jgi:23S rRNA U2552 (ribose-2'-O)-methylase RlmE/FtsJ
MANSDKDILITPNKGQTAKPKIEFTGADNSTKTITINDDGTLSFDSTIAATSGSVADGNANLVTGDAVFDYIAAQGFTTEVGDITAVTAGTGLSGGGTSGAVTLTNAGVTSIIAGSNISIDSSTGAVTITGTDTNTQLSTEQVQDIVGGMVDGGTETNISVTYDDTNGKLNFVSTDTNTQLTQEQVEDFVAGVIVAGSNITKTYDDAAGTLTLAATDTNTQLTTEQVQDIVGAMFTSNTETRISATYEDGDGTIDLVVDDMTADTQLSTEQVQDIVGAMFTGNTETGIAATYEDGDGTIDLVVSSVGDTTGNAATATALETARTIGGVSFDGTANINLPGVNTAGNQNTSGNAATATLASTVTVSDSTANTNFPVVFHDESNALLDDTNALRYNPSTGTLLVPNLNVAGTTTQVNTVTMEAANAVVFEGATSDDFETTLTIVDPTADRTISLPNAGGTVAVSASGGIALSALGDITANLSASHIPNLAASKITSGTLGTARIPNLATSKITSGTFADARVAESNVTQHQAALSITESQISDLQSYLTSVPNQAASIITSGTFADARIAESNVTQHLAAGTGLSLSGKTFSANLSASDIPNLAASKITSGTFATARIADDAITNAKMADDAIDSDQLADGSIDAVHLNVTAAADSGADNYLLSYNHAGGNFTWVASGGGGENNQNAFSNVAVSGQTTVAADSTTDTLTLAEGSNVTITTNASNDTVTIAATDTNTQLSTEQVQDIVGAMFSSNTETRISATYQDGDGTIDLVVDDMTADTNTQLSDEQVQDIVGAMFSSNTETRITATYQDGDGTIDLVVDNDLSNYDNSSSGFITSTLTTEQVQDIVGAMFTGNTETRVSATYQDGDGTIDLVVDDMTTDTNTNQLTTFTLTGDSGSNQTIAHGNTLDIAGGDGIATVVGSTDTVTVGLDIDGMTDIGAALADADLMIVDDGAGGTNRKATMSRLKTYMQNGLTFTTDTNLTTEEVQDIVGAMVSGNTESNIAVTYDDTNGKLNFASTDTNTQLTLLDEDNFASNSATAAASQQSIKAYVDAEVSGLVDSAPSTLNTLNELAAALGDDASFSTTTATSLGNRLRIDVSNQGLNGTQKSNALTNLGITASLSEINILESGLSASDIPNLATSKITSGTFADGRIAQSNVTQHLAVSSGGGIGLSGKTFSLDIDGMDDINAALVDADLMIIDDGANGTNRKATMSRLKTYMQNNLTFTTNTDTQLSTEQVQDIVGGMFSGNTETNITATYQDGDGTIDLVGSQMTFILEDDDGTEVSISNAEEVKFHSSDTSIDINYTDISTGSDSDPFDLSFKTLHAPYIKTADDRDFAPEDLTTSQRQIFGLFSTKTGLEDGSTTNASDYTDTLVFDTYTSGSGGDANLLALSKTSTQRIYHYRAARDATDWGTASTVAYISDIPTNTNQLTNGAGFITSRLAASDITGATALTSGLASTDELVLSDAGTLKRMDVSVLQSYMQSNLSFTNNAGDITGVTAGTGLSGGGASGAVTLAVDLSELTDMTAAVNSSEDELIILDNGADRRKLISEIPLSAFNNDSSFTSNAGTVTQVSVGTGLDVSNATTTPTISIDLSEFTDMTAAINSSQDELILLDNGAERRKLISEIPLSAFDNDSGFTTNTGDITAVVAGNGLTGGATSGSATLNIGAGTGIDVAADAISVDVSDFMTNGANNRIVTATGTDAMNAESGLTWDGTTLIVDGHAGDAVLSLRADSDNSGELDQPYMEFVLDGGTTHSSIGHSSDVFHNDNTDNNTLIIANSVATNDSGSGIVLKTGNSAGHENAVEALRIGPDRKIRFNDTYTFPLTDGSNGQVLTTNGSGTLSFTTVSGGGGTDTNTFVIVGEESDVHIASTAAAGGANGFQMSFGNGARNTTNSSTGTDFGVALPVACTLSRIDIAFGNNGSETNSSNQTMTVFKNRSASTTTMQFNASGTGGNAFVRSFTSLSGDGLSYAAGDTFNLRTTGMQGYTNTQVGPARMTAYFTVA